MFYVFVQQDKLFITENSYLDISAMSCEDDTDCGSKLPRCNDKGRCVCAKNKKWQNGKCQGGEEKGKKVGDVGKGGAFRLYKYRRGDLKVIRACRIIMCN